MLRGREVPTGRSSWEDDWKKKAACTSQMLKIINIR